MRNFLNVLEDMLGVENHYLEFAMLFPDRREYYLKMMDDTRMLRQKLVKSVAFNTESWCQLKHLLHGSSNLREVVEKSYRQGMDVSEVLGCLSLLSKLVKRQVDRMYEEKKVKKKKIRLPPIPVDTQAWQRTSPLAKE